MRPLPQLLFLVAAAWITGAEEPPRVLAKDLRRGDFVCHGDTAKGMVILVQREGDQAVLSILGDTTSSPVSPGPVSSDVTGFMRVRWDESLKIYKPSEDFKRQAAAYLEKNPISP